MGTLIRGTTISNFTFTLFFLIKKNFYKQSEKTINYSIIFCLLWSIHVRVYFFHCLHCRQFNHCCFLSEICCWEYSPVFREYQRDHFHFLLTYSENYMKDRVYLVVCLSVCLSVCCALWTSVYRILLVHPSVCGFSRMISHCFFVQYFIIVLSHHGFSCNITSVLFAHFFSSTLISKPGSLKNASWVNSYCDKPKQYLLLLYRILYYLQWQGHLTHIYQIT